MSGSEYPSVKPSTKRSVTLSLPGYQRNDNRMQPINLLEKHIQDLRQFPVQVLTETDRYLHNFNRCKQKSSRRFELVERSAVSILPLINQVYSQYYKSDPLPEDDEKRQLLTLAAKICNEMALAYMRVFEHDMNLSMLRFNSVRDRLQQCTHRAMEWVHAEQRLRSLRYQDLSADTWRNLNAVFHAVYSFAKVEYQQPSLGIIHLSPSANAGKNKSTKKKPPPELRLVTVYLAIQLHGSVDVFSMATQQCQITARHLLKYSGKLDIHRHNGDAVMSDHILTHAMRDSSPSSNPFEGEYWGYSIDVSEIKQDTLREYETAMEALMHSDAAKAEVHDASSSVSNQDDIERLIALRQILKGFEPYQRSEERRYIGPMDALFMYCGYKSCYQILTAIRQLGSDQESDPDSDSAFRDMLAQRSALIADDQDSNEQSQWLIANSGSNGILAETRESRFTHKMFVGQLLIYGIDDISRGEYTLGYLARMHRDMSDKLQIAIINISNQAELVAIQNPHLKKSALALPGILLADYRHGLGLILHSSHRLRAGSDITLIRANQHTGYSIGTVDLIQREFTVYQLISD